MQHQNERPISTYDNLSATANTPQSKVKQPQRALWAGESSGQLERSTSINNSSKSPEPHLFDNNESSYLGCNSALSGASSKQAPDATVATTTTKAQDWLNPSVQDNATEPLNQTSQHSIAAVKAALSDAKSKFFGINNSEKLDEPAPTTSEYDFPAQKLEIKTNPKYQNVPQSFRASALPEASSFQTMKPPSTGSKRYDTTYEHIPLSDLDALQPLQAVYMSTTVPQNMKGMKIAGRHTPTRNSLRHSRMIVVNNKNYDSIQETYSSHIRNLNISRQLLILQLAIGLLIVGLAIWILILAPSASILINPYLSGLSLILASIAGLIVLGRERRAEYNRTHNNCYKVLVAESYVFSALALVFCCLALVCAAIEFVELQQASAPTDGSCGPIMSSLLSYHNCTCSTERQTTAIPEALAGNVDSGKSYTESCEAIRGEWKYLLGFSMSLHAVGIFATFFCITIFIYCRHSSQKHFNTTV